ncbi:hypothetical protein D3C73_903830 [compost metagenome]
MQPAARRADERRRLSDRLDHAAFVIGVMNGDDGSPRPRQRLSQPGQIDHAIGVHRQNLDLRAARRSGFGYARMLSRPDDQPFATGGQGAVDRLGVGLGSARGEDDRRRIGADQISHLSTGRLNARTRTTAGGVNGRRVSIVSQGLGHDLLNFRTNQAGSVVI